MKYLVALALIGLAFAKRFDGDQVLTLYPKTEGHLQAIRSFDAVNVDYWKPDSSESIEANKIVEIRVQSEYVRNVKRALVKEGISYKVKMFDVQETINQQFDVIRKNRGIFGDQSYDYNVYHTASEIEQWVSDIAAANPELARASVLGKTTESRNINMLTLGKSANNPLVVIDCGMHAREWISPAVCQCYVDHLISGYGKDQALTDLMDQLTFAIIPVLNVDGYEYSWTNDRMWRKTRSNYGTLCDGVDPNRNFNAGWSGPGASSNPCSETYYGPSVASEPLSQALQGFIEANRGKINMYVTFHSYGQVYIYPYSYAVADVDNADEHENLFQDAAAAIKAVHGKTFEGGPGYASMYLAAGGSDDYAYDFGAKMSYTIELRDNGRYGFILPESQIHDSCEEIYAGLDLMFKHAKDMK